MKSYGTCQSTVKPQYIEINETKVFVYEDIEEIIIGNEDKETVGYQFTMIEYDKDEYIQMISNKNETMESEITDTQLALCDVYEMIGGIVNG